MTCIPRLYLCLLTAWVAVEEGYAQLTYCSYLYQYNCKQSCELGETEIRSPIRLCYSGKCCKPGSAIWSEWSPWRGCSVTCGTGFRIRTRTCTGESCPSNTDFEKSTCSTQTCSETSSSCGRKIPSPLRILSGETTQACEYPWMVNFALYTLSSGLIGNSCGGVLLSSTAVLTQTSCIEDMLAYTESSLNEGDLSIVAVAGDHRTEIRDDHQQSRLVTNDLTVSKGELTIVRLDPPVRYTDCVASVCLPEVNTVFGEQCTVAGWGQTHAWSPWSDVLRDHRVTLMSHKTCDAVFRFLNNETLPADYLCTDTQRDGTGTCSGDQGGMLMCKDERSESEMLAGITNSTECTANRPSTYINIIPYLDWIRDSAADLN